MKLLCAVELPTNHNEGAERALSSARGWHTLGVNASRFRCTRNGDVRLAHRAAVEGQLNLHAARGIGQV
jgi:hypothetical protein